MHIIHDTEFVSPAKRGSGLIGWTVAVLQAWRAREAERRLLLELNERLREDCGVGPAAHRGVES